MELEQRIAQRIAELKEERQKYFIDANKTLAMFDAAIGELEHLIAPQEDANAG